MSKEAEHQQGSGRNATNRDQQQTGQDMRNPQDSASLPKETGHGPKQQPVRKDAE